MSLGDSVGTDIGGEDRAGVALPPSGAARSQVDQGRRRGYHKMNYKITTVQCLNVQKR